MRNQKGRKPSLSMMAIEKEEPEEEIVEEKVEQAKEDEDSIPIYDYDGEEKVVEEVEEEVEQIDMICG